MTIERRASKLEGTEPARELEGDDANRRPSGFRQRVVQPLDAEKPLGPPKSQPPPSRARSGWTVIEEFAQGGYFYRVMRRAIDHDRGEPQLTQREEQELAHAVDGASNKSIAHALGLSPSTVGVLLFRAASKLGVKSRAALLAKYRGLKKAENSLREPHST